MSEQPPPPASPPPPPPPPPPAASGAGAPGDLLTRFLARFIDSILLGLAISIVFGALGLATFGLTQRGGWFLTSLGTILSAAVVVGYFAFMESSRGQTIGKMVTKLRVEALDGQKPTMEQAVKRNLFNAISVISIVPLIGGFISGIGSLAAVIYIIVTINGDPVARRGWHDKFGGTRVIKTG